MKLSELKTRFGDEYPNAIVVDGVRLPLSRETRFMRCFYSHERKMSNEISRFMDGSANITASEFFREWPNWDETVRRDFCSASCWLHEQEDYPEMLRFIMQHGEREHRSSVALSVASCLPQGEAFEILTRELKDLEVGQTSNIAQAISKTKHPDADTTLRRLLAVIWAHPKLWENSDFLNWIGFDATTCITHLIEIGANPNEFTDQVQRLSQHVCSHNRESCKNFLSKYYPWLKNQK